GVGEVGLATHHHDGNVWRAFADLFERRQPVGTGRHQQIEQHHVRAVLDDACQRLIAVWRFDRVEAVRLQQRADHAPDIRFIVDEQDAGTHVPETVGKTIANVAPPPSVSLMAIVPRCDSSVTRTSARPRPVPSAFVVKYGSKTRCRSSAGMAGPWSAIATPTPAPSPLPATPLVPLPGV